MEKRGSRCCSCWERLLHRILLGRLPIRREKEVLGIMFRVTY